MKIGKKIRKYIQNLDNTHENSERYSNFETNTQSSKKKKNIWKNTCNLKPLKKIFPKNPDAGGKVTFSIYACMILTNVIYL